MQFKFTGQDKFESLVECQLHVTCPLVDTPCHIWKGSLDPAGGPRMSIAGQTHRARRLAFLYAKGRLVTRYTVRRMCTNPLCVNADHAHLVPK